MIHHPCSPPTGCEKCAWRVASATSWQVSSFQPESFGDATWGSAQLQMFTDMDCTEELAGSIFSDSFAGCDTLAAVIQPAGSPSRIFEDLHSSCTWSEVDPERFKVAIEFQMRSLTWIEKFEKAY